MRTPGCPIGSPGPKLNIAAKKNSALALGELSFFLFNGLLCKVTRELRRRGKKEK
jgi:hypothetical protein